MSNDIASSTARALRELPCKPLGAQPAFASEKLEDFVRERRIAVLAYVRADGRPHQMPIWYTYRDGMFYMTTVAGATPVGTVTPCTAARPSKAGAQRMMMGMCASACVSTPPSPPVPSPC